MDELDLGDYYIGTDILGSSTHEDQIVGATTPEPGGGPFVTVHFKNVADVVRAKAGAVGGLLAGLAPDTIAAKVYGETAKKIADGMKQEGIDAEVKVVTTRPSGGPFGKDFLVGGAVGISLFGVGYGLFRLGKMFIGRK